MSRVCSAADGDGDGDDDDDDDNDDQVLDWNGIESGDMGLKTPW